MRGELQAAGLPAAARADRQVAVRTANQINAESAAYDVGTTVSDNIRVAAGSNSAAVPPTVVKKHKSGEFLRRSNTVFFCAARRSLAHRSAVCFKDFSRCIACCYILNFHTTSTSFPGPTIILSIRASVISQVRFSGFILPAPLSSRLRTESSVLT